ncbi:MAG: fibronectin type III domain-containing protein, partial [Actinomycetes bacterium]
NGTVSYAVTDGTGGCTISGNTLTAVSAGTCVVTATKAQEGNYNAATSNNVTITVARRAQIVTFAKPADRNFSTTAFTVAPSVDSGLTPVLASQTTNVCTVSGMSVTMVDSGTCTLVASSNSTTNYAAATDVTQSFIISAVVPYAPILDSLTASDGSISASFTLGNSGGSALLNHEYSSNNGATWSPWPNGSITSPLNISNLTNGVEYQVKIRAVNTIGAGAESNMLAVTPLAPVIVVAAPVQTAESTTTVVSSSTTVFVVTTVKRNPVGRGTTTTVARRAVTTTVASRNGQIATTTTTVITTTTTGSTTTTSPATSTTSVERQPAIVERATSTTVKTQTSIFQSFTPTVPSANVPDTIPARLSPTDVASVVAGQSAQVIITEIEKQQVHAAIGESTMMVASVGENGALEPLLANGSVAFTRGSTLRVDGTGMLPGS